MPRSLLRPAVVRRRRLQGVRRTAVLGGNVNDDDDTDREAGDPVECAECGEDDLRFSADAATVDCVGCGAEHARD